MQERDAKSVLSTGRKTAGKTQQQSQQQQQGVAVVPGVPTKSEQVGLAHFNLIKVIGRGSYAKVFQVEYKPTGKIYAMKVIKKQIITDEEVCVCYVSFFVSVEYARWMF